VTELMSSNMPRRAWLYWPAPRDELNVVPFSRVTFKFAPHGHGTDLDVSRQQSHGCGHGELRQLNEVLRRAAAPSLKELG